MPYIRVVFCLSVRSNFLSFRRYRVRATATRMLLDASRSVLLTCYPIGFPTMSSGLQKRHGEQGRALQALPWCLSVTLVCEEVVRDLRGNITFLGLGEGVAWWVGARQCFARTAHHLNTFRTYSMNAHSLYHTKSNMRIERTFDLLTSPA